MKRLSTLFAAIVLPLAAAPALHAADAAPAPPPATVEIADAIETQLAPIRWVHGSVISRDDARIASVAAGRVIEIAEVGSVLAQGQRVAKLDDTALRLRLEQVRAESGRSKAQRDLAASQMARFERLASVVAQAQIDEVRATLASAEQEMARIGAQRRGIEHEIAETEIRAPFAGIVSERFVQRGEYLNLGAAVAHLVDTRRLEARVLAPLALAPRISAGQRLDVRLAGAVQPAKVRTIVPVGDERSRQFELRLALPEGYALVGSAIEVALPDGVAIGGIAVPRDALVLREAETYVMRIKADDTAERVAVKVGVARDAMIEIVSGELAAGDRIVVRGAERLAHGQSVRIAKSG